MTNMRKNRTYKDEMMLPGGAGADVLDGGIGDDTFVFSDGNGEDRITDFRDNRDLIDLQSFDLSGFADLVVTQVADGVRVDLEEHGGGAILLEDFDIGRLDTSDFLF